MKLSVSDVFKYLVLYPILLTAIIFAFMYLVFNFDFRENWISVVFGWALACLFFSNILTINQMQKEYQDNKAARKQQDIQVEAKVNAFLMEEYPEVKSQLENEIAEYLQSKLIEFENKTGFQPDYVVVCIESVTAIGQPDKSIVTSVEIGEKVQSEPELNNQ